MRVAKNETITFESWEEDKRNERATRSGFVSLNQLCCLCSMGVLQSIDRWPTRASVEPAILGDALLDFFVGLKENTENSKYDDNNEPGPVKRATKHQFNRLGVGSGMALETARATRCKGNVQPDQHQSSALFVSHGFASPHSRRLISLGDPKTKDTRNSFVIVVVAVQTCFFSTMHVAFWARALIAPPAPDLSSALSPLPTTLYYTWITSADGIAHKSKQNLSSTASHTRPALEERDGPDALPHSILHFHRRN